MDAYEITSQDLDARAEIVSRFVIDHTNERERKFTCVARSGGKTARATTTLVQSKNLATSARELDGNKPRILSHYTRLFNPIGQNVILPCKATGKPDPDYSWKNQNDEIIGANDQRFRVLSTGDLRIFGLQFSDMGTYTCTAENVLSKDTAKTFVYPLVSILAGCIDCMRDSFMFKFFLDRNRNHKS